MNALRLAAAALATTSVLIGAALISCNDVINVSLCNVPTLGETGVDGGPDPCHCDPLPSLNITGCGCLSNPGDQGSIDDFNACMALVRVETDAGGEGGP